MKPRWRQLLLHSIWIFLLPLMAMGMRAALASRTSSINGDGIGFIQMAQSYQETSFTQIVAQYRQHPLYPMLIAHTYPVTGNWEVAGRLISILFGSLAVIPLYLLASQILGSKTVGVWVGLLYVLSPYFIRVQSQVFSEAVFHFFLYWSLYWGWLSISKDHVLGTGLCGLAAGFAYLTRPEGLGVCLVVGGWIAVHVIVQTLFFKRLSSGHPVRIVIRLGLLVMLLIAFLVPALPYLVSLHNSTGEWSITSKKKADKMFQLGQRDYSTHGEGTALSRERKYYYRKEPANRTLSNAQNMVVSGMELAKEVCKASYIPFFLLVLLGLVFRPTIQRNVTGESYLALVFLLFSIVYFFLIYHSGYLDKRHALTLSGLSLFWGGIVLEEICRWAARKELPTRFWRTSYGIESPSDYKIILVLLLVLISLPKSLRDPQKNQRVFRAAGDWISETYSSDASMLTNKDRVGFYSGLSFERVIPATPKLVLSQLRATQSRLLVMEEQKDFDRFLQDEKWKEIEGLRRVKQLQDGKHSVIIFEWTP